jgi:hypothetical protein
LASALAQPTPAKPPPTTTTDVSRSVWAIAQSPGLECMMPPSAKIVVAVR